MADCGASGSALDRTARAILSGNDGSSAAAKQVASVVGHAIGAGGATVMGVQPMTSPDHIVLPGSSVPVSAKGPPATAKVAAAVAPQHIHSVAAPRTAAPRGWQQMQPPPSHIPMQQQHHHHQMAAAAAAQHQHHHQMMMMQQQQQHMQLMIQQQQQQQQLRIQQQQQQNATSLDNWHEGLEEQAKSEIDKHLESAQDDVATTVGHEGNVQGATIEELAAAWAQAEEEYQNVLDEEDAATTNLWQGEDQHQIGHAATETYEFINKQPPETINQSQANWMEEGLRQFKAGNLKEAIQAFEMELQQNNADNATAWRMLGRCHAENDMDALAIQCLEQAVDRDPYSPEALLALGVSYVNELNHDRALENLKAWITHNPTFAGLELVDDDDVYGAAGATTQGDSAASAFDDVQRLLLRALDYAPSDAADVLEALGVVYNVSRDYDAAVDSFRQAIELRADDYQLWNKLGATLANGQRSEEALPAYNKALELKPKYARAWLNMAISHSNMQNYDEAARCYLQTLSLNPTAVHCWSYLRIALSCCERWDLIPLVAEQDLKAFHEHFRFVLY